MRINIIYGLFVVLLSYSHASNAQCQFNKNELSAEYQLTVDKGNGKVSVQPITLYRHHQNVVYQYSDQGISEYWHQQSNGLIALTRYFDQAKQGIEYQASEINNKQSWQQINELISPQLRKKMHLISTVENACQTEQTWQLKQPKSEIILTWLPQLNLVKSLTIKSATQSKQWQLYTLTTVAEKVAEKFVQWQQYKTTDYADVGDNEDDPFLAKMINLGFVEHGASGFYQADGHVIAAEHH